MAFEPSRDRETVEAFYTARRLTELRLRPVEGSFDSAHLREINRRIFQDMPAQGFNDVTPGEFRSAAPAGRDWVKHRSLQDGKVTSYVAYSTMDAASVGRLDRILAGVDLDELRQQTTQNFAKSVAKLYAQLDYIHPFADGNSRTLREFTRSLAAAAGFDLRWEMFGQTRGGRDVLCVARDLSVNAIALHEVRNEDTRRDIAFTSDQFEGNRDLVQLLVSAGAKVVRPNRAVGFEQLDPSAALTRFPELMPIYEQLARADTEASRTFADNAEARARAVSAVRSRMQAALDAGDLQVKAGVRNPGDRAKPHDPER
jgi:cell filamentation protein